MDLKPGIFTAKVMHKRLLPKENSFTYRTVYLALPLSQLSHQQLGQILPVNRKGFVSFCESDHGAMDGSSLEHWIRNILADYELNTVTYDIILVSMPRVLNYVFNPVSFWLCFDVQQKLRAVLCQVNNTFGETHNYLCMHQDRGVIEARDWLFDQKVFHVSPFLKREGYYKFRFDTRGQQLKICIDFYNNTEKQLITTLTGNLNVLTRAEIRRNFWMNPLMTLKVIGLIHWQALKLITKGIPYISKPTQLKPRLTSAVSKRNTKETQY